VQRPVASSLWPRGLRVAAGTGGWSAGVASWRGGVAWHRGGGGRGFGARRHGAAPPIAARKESRGETFLTKT